MVDCRKGPAESRRLLRAVLPNDERRLAQNIADQSADRSGGGKPELERRNQVEVRKFPLLDVGAALVVRPLPADEP